MKFHIPFKQKHHLVGGWTNPFEKYARQIGSFPQVGMNTKNIWVATTQTRVKLENPTINSTQKGFVRV